MLFVFRTLNVCALGAIFLTPFWLFNSTLDRLLPHAPPAAVMAPRFDTATARLRDQFVTVLGGLKREIHADICRRGREAPRVLEARCQ